MQQRTTLLILLACASPGLAAPDLVVTERVSIDLAPTDCSRRAVLEVGNLGDAPVWGLAFDALDADGRITATRHLAAPLAPGGFVTVLVCRPETIRGPDCFEARALQLGDSDVSGIRTAPGSRWCAPADATRSSPPVSRQRHEGDDR
jgi:hypothetical protein